MSQAAFLSRQTAGQRSTANQKQTLGALVPRFEPHCLLRVCFIDSGLCTHYLSDFHWQHTGYVYKATMIFDGIVSGGQPKLIHLPASLSDTLHNCFRYRRRWEGVGGARS
jgi:hypothetical protein